MTAGSPSLTRRAFAELAARLGLAAATLGWLDVLAVAPPRAAAAGVLRRRPSDIQFDLADVLGPARRIGGVVVRFPPVYTSFTTLALRRRPTAQDQHRLEAALLAIERRHEFGPRGVAMTLAYGVPYFGVCRAGSAGGSCAGASRGCVTSRNGSPSRRPFPGRPMSVRPTRT